MDYITHGTPFSSYAKRGYMRQCFLHNPKQEVNATNITLLYLDHVVDEDDLEILKFVWKAEFSVQEQINRYALAHNIEHVADRIKKLFDNRLIHKFFLYSGEKDGAPGDAEIIFCLAEGGKMLIEKYVDEFIVWNLENISISSPLVAKNLIDTELWLNIMFGATNLDVMEYSKRPKFYVDKETLVMTSNYLFEVEGRNYYMIMDVVDFTKDVLRLRPRIRQISKIFETNIWKKYYPDTSKVPMLLFVVDTDEDADRLARELAATTRLKPENYRFTTSERMKEGIGTDKSFILYDKDTEELYETGIAIFK